MPNFDKEKCARIEEAQYGFGMFIEEMYSTWNMFCPCDQILSNFRSNTKTWQERIGTNYDSDEEEIGDDDGHRSGEVDECEEDDEIEQEDSCEFEPLVGGVLKIIFLSVVIIIFCLKKKALNTPFFILKPTTRLCRHDRRS